MPFRKFAQRGFLRYERDVSRLRFAPALWSRIGEEDALGRVRALAEAAVSAYYARIQQSARV